MKSKTELKGLAKIAADAYISKEKTPLNDSIVKLAKQHDLTPHQVEVVVSEANAEAWKQLFKLEKTASYDFPVADLPSILTTLSKEKKDAVTKVASDISDYLKAPVKPICKEASDFKAPEMDAGEREALRRSLQKELTSHLQALDVLENDLAEETFATMGRLNSSIMELGQQVKVAMLDCYSEKERKEGLLKVAEVIAAEDMPQELKLRCMNAILDSVEKNMLIKKADLEAPEALLSKNFPGHVINGRSNIAITLKTVKSCDKYLGELRGRHDLIDTSRSAIEERIHVL